MTINSYLQRKNTNLLPDFIPSPCLDGCDLTHAPQNFLRIY